MNDGRLHVWLNGSLKERKILTKEKKMTTVAKSKSQVLVTADVAFLASTQ